MLHKAHHNYHFSATFSIPPHPHYNSLHLLKCNKIQTFHNTFSTPMLPCYKQPHKHHPHKKWLLKRKEVVRKLKGEEKIKGKRSLKLKKKNLHYGGHHSGISQYRYKESWFWGRVRDFKKSNYRKRYKETWFLGSCARKISQNFEERLSISQYRYA